MPIRPATREDAEAILDIYNEAVLTTTASADCIPRSLERQLEWFDMREREGLPTIVFDEGGVLGYGSLDPYAAKDGYRFTVVNSVYVAEAARRRGIGHRLLEALVEEARARGFRTIVAKIADENDASLRLHERLGFVESGRLPEVIYKFDRWIGVVFMRKRL